MYEQRHQPLLSAAEFRLRLLWHALGAAGLVIVSLGIGVLGYHHFESMSWIDSLVNAAMILGGMGPVGQLNTTGGKIFASVYALYSGIVFLVSVAVLFAPVLHRWMHRFHVQTED